MSSLAWVCLMVAGLMEPCWVIGLKMSKGLKDLKWTAITVIFLIASMYLLAIAIEMDIPVGTAYAVWTGIGAIGALVAGWALFKERRTVVEIFFVMLIMVGIAGVQMTAGP